MEALDTSSTSAYSSLLTSPNSDEYDEHNMWNPMLGFFCHEHVGAFGRFRVFGLGVGDCVRSLHLWCEFCRLTCPIAEIYGFFVPMQYLPLATVTARSSLYTSDHALRRKRPATKHNYPAWKLQTQSKT